MKNQIKWMTKFREMNEICNDEIWWRKKFIQIQKWETKKRIENCIERNEFIDDCIINEKWQEFTVYTFNNDERSENYDCNNFIYNINEWNDWKM